MTYISSPWVPCVTNFVHVTFRHWGTGGNFLFVPRISGSMGLDHLSRERPIDCRRTFHLIEEKKRRGTLCCSNQRAPTSRTDRQRDLGVESLIPIPRPAANSQEPRASMRKWTFCFSKHNITRRSKKLHHLCWGLSPSKRNRLTFKLIRAIDYRRADWLWPVLIPGRGRAVVQIWKIRIVCLSVRLCTVSPNFFGWAIHFRALQQIISMLEHHNCHYERRR